MSMQYSPPSLIGATNATAATDADATDAATADAKAAGGAGDLQQSPRASQSESRVRRNFL